MKKLCCYYFIISSTLFIAGCSGLTEIRLERTKVESARQNSFTKATLESVSVPDSHKLYKTIIFPPRYLKLKLAAFHFQYHQYTYYLYSSGQIDETAYKLRMNNDLPDLNDVTSDYVDEEIVLGYCKDKDSNLVAFIDTNNNNDLSDEQEVTMDKMVTDSLSEDQIRIRPVFNITYKYFDGKDICSRTIPVQLAYSKFGMLMRPGSVGLYFISPEAYYFAGKINVNNSEYKIAVKEMLDIRRKEYTHISVAHRPDFTLDRIINSPVSYFVANDTFSIGGQYFKFENSSPLCDKIYLKRLHDNVKPIGPFDGLYAPEMTGKTFDQLPFSLSSFRGKYVLLNIYGINQC